MRILAIRGRNLASLQGDFAVELEEEPLASAGLFAITGPTGAGKSTILDALCLALFDRTPRLMKGGGVPIGRDDEEESLRLTSGDVRSLLRRGTAAGHAEVDFLGRDARRYRARWTVRRAREKAEGRFQAQTLELRDLNSGQALGGTKTETLTAIEERLGLSFDQFRRSALLPQGDFAAFLRADERERSELLERMTGTEIYGELSRAAYRKAQEEERALKELEGQASALSILGAEERTAREALLEELTAALSSTRARLEEARRASQWHRTRERLLAGEEEAAQGIGRAEDAWTEAEASRVELAEREAAEPLRLPLASAGAADADARHARSALEALGREAASAASAQTVGEAAHGEAQAAAALAEAAREAARPSLDQAKELDARVGDALHLSGEAEEASGRAAGAAQAAERDLAGLAAEERSASVELAMAEEWLLAHQALSPLASQWERWRRELDRLTAAWRRLRELGDLRPTCEARRAAGREAERQARETLDRSEARLGAARAALAAADAEASAGPPADLRAQRSRWDSRREGLRELANAAREAAETLAEERDTHRAAEKASADRRAAEDQGRDSLVRAGRVEAALGEADLALAQARLALDLSSHRAELTEGEPCPLCGATSHPWAAEGSPVAELVSSQQRRVEELRAELTGLERLEAASRQQATVAAAALEAEAARATALAGRLAALQELWERGRRELPDAALPGDVTDPSAADTASAGFREAAERLRELQAAEERADELAKAVAREQKALDRAREALDGDATACLRAAQEAAAAEQALQELERSREVEDQACQGHLAELSPAFDGWDGWRPSLEADPLAFATACAERVAAWNARAAAKDESRERLAALRPRVEGARTLSAERSAQAEGKASEAVEKARALEALRAERSSLLGGRPTGQVEAELDEAARRAAEGRERTREAFERAQRAFAAASARREAGEAALASREAAREAAALALTAALAEAGLDRETLRARLARDEAWVVHVRGRLDSLAKALEAAKAVLRERRSQRERHDETDRPELSSEQAAEAAGAEGTAAAQTEEERYRCRLALDHDDAERGRAWELLPRIEAQRRRTDLWRGLSELIGSADGKRFRVFAQSLTLDALLGHANGHLRDLAPRYRLERVPGHDLELQVVDQDMGDEVRGVASLSGGESFLVSMALALGLSSLSSRAAAVGSLFVDEGFGSLDPDTLEVALAALDSLQASGRKVGLISHVPGLAERIGARVRVVPLGGGRSRVEVLGAR